MTWRAMKCRCLAFITSCCEPAVEGRSALPLLRGARIAARPIFAEATYERPQRALRTAEGLKLIEWTDEGRRELYDTASDPTERSPRDDSDAERLAATLDDWQRESRALGRALRGGADATRVELDDETRARLEALGYGVTGEAPPEP